MKITISKLQQIIKEETKKVAQEINMFPGETPRGELPDGCWQKVGPPPQNWTRCKAEASLEKPEPSKRRKKYIGGYDTQAEWDQYMKDFPEDARHRRGYGRPRDPAKWPSLQAKKKWLALPPEQRMPVLGSGVGFGGLDDKEKAVLKKHQQLRDKGWVLVDPYKLIYHKKVKRKKFNHDEQRYEPYTFTRTVWVDAGREGEPSAYPMGYDPDTSWGDPKKMDK